MAAALVVAAARVYARGRSQRRRRRVSSGSRRATGGTPTFPRGIGARRSSDSASRSFMRRSSLVCCWQRRKWRIWWKRWCCPRWWRPCGGCAGAVAAAASGGDGGAGKRESSLPPLRHGRHRRCPARKDVSRYRSDPSNPLLRVRGEPPASGSGGGVWLACTSSRSARDLQPGGGRGSRRRRASRCARAQKWPVKAERWILCVMS